MKTLKIKVTGKPEPQPRTKARNAGGFARVYNPTTADTWKSLIAQEAVKHGIKFEKDDVLSVTAFFYFDRPKAHYKKSGELKDTCSWYVTKKPDIDNLLKAVFDALVSCGVIYDDACIARVTAHKIYAGGEKLPGMSLTVGLMEVNE